MMDYAALWKRLQAAEQAVRSASSQNDKIRAEDELDACHMQMGVNGLSRTSLEKLAKGNAR